VVKAPATENKDPRFGFNPWPYKSSCQPWIAKKIKKASSIREMVISRDSFKDDLP